jgi:hypothetical protein
MEPGNSDPGGRQPFRRPIDEPGGDDAAIRHDERPGEPQLAGQLTEPIERAFTEDETCAKLKIEGQHRSVHM